MNIIVKALMKICRLLGYKNYCLDKNSSMGIHTYIGKGTCVTKTKIGNYCSIGTDVLIGPGEHDFSKITTSMEFCAIDPYESLTQSSCEIEHDVWIGSNAVILRGVTIGTGAVVGAHAVVTKSIPPYAIAVGIPAKVIKYRFSENKIVKLLASNWFLKNKEEAALLIKRLENE